MTKLCCSLCNTVFELYWPGPTMLTEAIIIKQCPRCSAIRDKLTPEVFDWLLMTIDRKVENVVFNHERGEHTL